MGKAPSHKKDNFSKPKWAKEQDKFHSKTQYPYCKGTFPDCPKEINPDVVERGCRLCPLYRKK